MGLCPSISERPKRFLEVTVKARLLLTSVLFVFAFIPAPQAQVTVDFAKITCDQLFKEELLWTARELYDD